MCYVHVGLKPSDYKTIGEGPSRIITKKVIPNNILVSLTISVTKKRIGNELLTNITKSVMFSTVQFKALGPTK